MGGYVNQEKSFWVEGAVFYGDGVREMTRVLIRRRGDMTEPGRTTRHEVAHKWEDTTHGQRALDNAGQ